MNTWRDSFQERMAQGAAETLRCWHIQRPTQATGDVLMYRRRNTRTDLDLEASGDFTKIGKRHWLHASGLEIKHNCNTGRWAAVGWEWPTLEWAAYQVRKQELLRLTAL